MIKQISLSFISILLLSACSSNGPLFHSSRDYGSDDATKGIYLLEEPYQIKDVWYSPAEQYDYSEKGLASWYMPAGDSLLTANGEVYDANVFSARHKTLPLPSIVRITNLENNKSVIARVNDRGPMVNNRLVDVSQAAKEALGMPTSGTVMVQVEVLPEESKLAKTQMMEEGKITPESELKTENQEDNLTLIEPEEVKKASVLPDESEVIYQPEDHYVPEVKKQPVPAVEGSSKITLGSFSNPENAQKLKAKLSTHYPVSVEQVERNGRTLNVVKVGPYSQEEATTLLNQLKQKGYKDAYMAQ